MVRKPALTFPLLFVFIVSFSQNQDSLDLKFIEYLVNTRNFSEVLFLLGNRNFPSGPVYDSINYFRGWSLYSLKELPASSNSLLKVTTGSAFYFKSHFFAAYNLAHTGDLKGAAAAIDSTELKTETMVSLKNFQLAGISLLQEDIPGFRKFLSRADTGQYEISKASGELVRMMHIMQDHKRKSPFLAGMFSGILPGSGKYYAGKRGEAISAFLETAGLGAVTWENYHKRGLKNFGTLAFGTAFAFAYAANIYGAVLSASLLETEYKENVKNTILFNLHIPLRTIFGE